MAKWMIAAATVIALGACVDEGIDHAPRPPIEVGQSPISSKRLTQRQYKNAVHDLVGDVAVPIALENDVAVDGFFAVGAASTSITALGVERYESAAYEIAEQAMEPGPIRDALVPCHPVDIVDQPC